MNSISNCLRKAIYKGHISLDGDNPLDQVVLTGKCDSCSKSVTTTVRQLLYQPDYAGTDYEEGGEDAAIKCPGCGVGIYVSHICEGRPEFDSGKFHNHCSECPNFGECIGDYRMAHCRKCNKHYYAGAGDGCSNCSRSKNSFGKGFGGAFGRGRKGGRKGDCIIS